MWPALAPYDATTRARFEQTLKTGMRLLAKDIEELKAAGAAVLPGESAFKL